MRILLSQFRHPDDRIERETIGSEGELIVQSTNDGAWLSVPKDARASKIGRASCRERVL